ncbi:hypothetical protein QUC32_02710 [Novosphingobium resinovorum]|uniref:hypothetical protein n=1 Tax=Novosphingobium TaxID=165696 RepID=UPI001B3C6149|nr:MULTISPECIES: hypothetical protein [Novosphingobium]MBF7013748.1 hypothetical protein [Novosphingobium sp. HR1a]WJM25892.1 hypothetical protein QUC32_02710 [Novosphingobium resinovorum]
MRALSTAPLQLFTVDVTFSSGGERFAVETYTIPASTWFMAEQQALQMSLASPYDNCRIPDLTRTAAFRPS